MYILLNKVDLNHVRCVNHVLSDSKTTDQQV